MSRGEALGHDSTDVGMSEELVVSTQAGEDRKTGVSALTLTTPPRVPGHLTPALQFPQILLSALLHLMTLSGI